jgi:tRNA(Ile2) C34 agmatinyltransferase TiaS
MQKDTDLFPIRCPNCGHDFKEIGRLKSGLDLRCPACNATIRYELSKVLRAMGQLRRGLYDFSGGIFTTVVNIQHRD